MTDCLNFGNPERPEVMRQLARAIDGIAAACKALDGAHRERQREPLQRDGRPGDPPDADRRRGRARARDRGHRHAVVQAAGRRRVPPRRPAPRRRREPASAGSEYAVRKLRRTLAGRGPPPSIDLDARAASSSSSSSSWRARTNLRERARRVGRRPRRRAGRVRDGAGADADVGARVDSSSPAMPRRPLEVASLLFGEHPARVIVSVRRAERGAGPRRRRRARASRSSELGVTGGRSLSIRRSAEARGRGARAPPRPVVAARGRCETRAKRGTRSHRRTLARLRASAPRVYVSASGRCCPSWRGAERPAWRRSRHPSSATTTTSGTRTGSSTSRRKTRGSSTRTSSRTSSWTGAASSSR